MSNAIKSGPRGRAGRWNEQEAAQALRECAESGLSIDAFARREGYSGQRLRDWKHRLGGKPTTAPVTFLPVKIAQSPIESAASIRHLAIDVGNVSVRVREDLDVEHLARIVGALDRATRRC